MVTLKIFWLRDLLHLDMLDPIGQTENFPEAYSHLSLKIYSSIFSLRPGGEDVYSRWLPIVAVARFSENIPELEKWLVEQVEKGL